MNTKGKVFISILLILIIVGALSTEVWGSEVMGLVPDNAAIVAYADTNKADPGLSYLLRLWKEKLVRQGQYKKRETIKEIYNKLGYVETAGVLFVDQKDTFQYVVIVKMVGKKDNDKEEEFNIFREDVETLIKKKEELKTLDYLDFKIIYSVDRYPCELSAYTCIGEDTIVIGTNIEVLKEVVGVKKGKVSSIARDKKFIEMKPRFIDGQDGFLYIDNKDGRFIKLLREWEKEHYMTLLLSGDFLNTICISFDIVDKDISRGRIVFITRQEGALFDDVQDDARFFDEVIKRKFMAEGVKYISEITINSQYVILDFKITGLELFWTKVFKEEGKGIFKSNERNNE